MIFICDVMLGKLARFLRMLGLDAPYIRQGENPGFPPEEGVPFLFFTKTTAKTGRPGAILVRSIDPQEQILEIREYIAPYINSAAVMTRCIECNVLLAEVRKEDIEPFVPEYIYHHHNEFRTCPSCRKVYWEGSHADDMNMMITKVIGDG